MQFLDLIPDKICHPEAIVLWPGPSLHCNACGKDVIGNVYQYICQPDRAAHFFYSSELAQAYAAWTGDTNVPMSFPLTDIEGIHDTVVVGQPLSRVQKSIRLLRALNAPFTDRWPVQEEAAAAAQDMSTFLPDFLNIVFEHPRAESSNEQMALEALIKSMHNILAMTNNLFDTYFNVLVPFVQKCPPATWKPLAAEPEDPNLAKELYLQLIRSFHIRKAFGRYAIPFDVLHVLVSCYACSCNMEVLGNWALDFLVRICRGDFFWARYADSAFVQTMRKLVNAEYSYKRKPEYYNQVVKPIRQGEVIEHYSQLWQPLHEVQAHLKKRYVVPEATPDMLDMAFVHTFPALLFREHADQLGFTMGDTHLIMTMNRRNGQLPKGAFKQAKRVHGVVQRFVQSVQRFEGDRPMIWTLDTVKLFFASDPSFEDEIMQVIRMLVVEEDEEE